MNAKSRRGALGNISPPLLLVLGYLLYVLIGTLLLSLPIAQEAPVDALDALFIATSAVSTTGLVTVDPGTTYTGIGEVVILLLIQLGGIGYMTFGSFVVLATRHKISAERVAVARATFALPEDFSVLRFLWRVVAFTVIIEGFGAALLWPAFAEAGIEDPLWAAVFHSVSAFCTAGFSLFPDNLAPFQGNVLVNLVIAALSFCGAIGFIVGADLWEKLSGKRKHLHFTSKVILRVTLSLTVLATLLLVLLEQSLASLPPWQRILSAFFQVMSATTTVGFNTADISLMSPPIIMILYLLMVFGASPSGTGGGLKSTTLAVLLALVKSTLKRRSAVRFFKREISQEHLQLATASFSFYMIVLFAAVTLLLVTESIAFEALLFEAISALGTVGLSVGATGDLTELGKLLIVLLMLMGRVGILTMGIALSMQDESPEEEADTELVL